VEQSSRPEIASRVQVLALIALAAPLVWGQCAGTCASPIVVSPTVTGSPGARTASATASVDTALCATDSYDTYGADGEDVILRFTAPFTGNATVDTCAAASFDTMLTALRGGHCTGPILAHDDDGCAAQSSEVTFGIVLQKEYTLVVDGAGGATGTATVTFNLQEGPGPGTLYFVEDGNPNGLHRIDLYTGAVVNLGASGFVSGNMGLAPSGYPGHLLGSAGAGLTQLETDGSGVVTLGTTNIEGMAYDYNRGVIYASADHEFFMVDPTTGASLGMLAPGASDIEALAYGGGDLVYGVCSACSTFNRYSIAANQWAWVGTLPMVVGDCGLAMDPASGMLFLKSGGDTMLYALDPQTAQLTPLLDTGILPGGGLAFTYPFPTRLYFSEDGNPAGLYLLDQLTGAALNVGVSGVVDATTGLAPGGARDLVLGSEPAGLLQIATDGSGSTLLGATRIEGLARDPRTGAIYASADRDLHIIDPATGSILTTLASASGDIEGLTYHDPTRQIVGVDVATDEIVLYDIATDTWLPFASPGIATDNCGIALEPWASSGYLKHEGDPILYHVDAVEGVARPVGDTGLTAGGGLAIVFGDVCRTRCGDCDQDGVGPAILDALLAAQITLALVIPGEGHRLCCDVNGDGAITILDALRMAQVAVALPAPLTCP
jgi:hypothetical protein